MSLSRILNDEPSPALSHPLSPSAPASMSVIDPALMSPTSQSGPRSSPHLRHGHPGEPPPPPRGYPGVAYQGSGGWDPYSGEWVQGDIFPLGRGNGDYYSRSERPETLSPHDPRSAYYREGEIDSSSRKRRREPDEEDDYRASGLRQGRVSAILTGFELHL
jgi:chromatin-remodeling ATPase INO80